MPRLPVRAHAMEEVTRHMVNLQSEKIADLRARDQDGDAVGKTDYDGMRKIFYDRAYAGDPENQKEHSGHHRDGEEALEPVLGDDARNNHNSCGGRGTDAR